MTTIQQRAQGVEFLGAGQGWAVYTATGYVVDAGGNTVTFADQDTAWAFADAVNTPA